jgi:hypothetical protein
VSDQTTSPSRQFLNNSPSDLHQSLVECGDLSLKVAIAEVFSDHVNLGLDAAIDVSPPTRSSP